MAVIRKIFLKNKMNKNENTHSWARGTNSSSLPRKPTGSLKAEMFSMKSRILVK